MSTQALHDILHHLFGKNQNWQINLLKNWNEIIGTLGTKVTLEKIYKDTIVLGVQDSCWLQELYLLSPVILKRINQTLDQPYVKNIRFKKQGIKKKKSKKKSYAQTNWNQNCKVTAQEEKALQSVPNSQLRNALKKFLIRCHKERGDEKSTPDCNRSHSH